MDKKVLAGRIITGTLWVSSFSLSMYTFIYYPTLSQNFLLKVMPSLIVLTSFSAVVSVLYLKYISPLQKSREIIENAMD
jgi:hypothetical protein